MGRDNVLPKRCFGVLDPTTSIPKNNVVLSGLVTLSGALLLSYEMGAELLNFGAFIAFMGVNIAAFAHYCMRLEQRAWTDWLPPVAGFVMCLFIWLHLSIPAEIVGASWLALGVVYGVARGSFKPPGSKGSLQRSSQLGRMRSHGQLQI